MKKILLFILFLININSKLFCQTYSIQIQFYDDANNNCAYNAGEQLLYYIPCAGAYFGYKNTSGNTVYLQVPSCPGPLTLITPSVPATNTLIVYTCTSGPVYITQNSACVFANLQYNSGTIYMPLQYHTNFWGCSMIVPGMTNSIIPSGGKIPICSNFGNDSLDLAFTLLNFHGCSNTVTTRTFSFYLDGVQFDKVALTSSSLTTSNSGYLKALENYATFSAYYNFKTKIPQGISVLGNHTYAIKSSPIYSGTNSSILNYSCTLYSTPCCKVSGKFYDDCNQNCIKDGGDMFSGIGKQGNISNSSGLNMSFSPDYQGNFSLFIPSFNSFSLSHFPSALGYSACTSNSINIPPATVTNTLLLGYKTASISPIDVSTYIHAWTNGLNNPGSKIKIAINTNLNNNYIGCTSNYSANPTIQKVVLKPYLTYVSTFSGTPPSSIIPAITGDTLLWYIANINTLTTICFSVAISSTIANLTPFNIDCWIYPSTDVNLLNNFSRTTGTIGAPFDPNYKEAYATNMLKDRNLPYGSTELNYNINFQNVGTAPAVVVKILDTMDLNIDLTTLQVLKSSFPVCAQIDYNSRLVGFIFDGINLPDSASNPTGSHGYVSYNIKLKNPLLLLNTTIKNRAHIYFDFNDAIATNQTKTKIVSPAGVLSIKEIQNQVSIYPNPGSEKLNIKSQIELKKVSFINTLGEIVKEVLINNSEQEVNINELPNSFYLLRFETQNNLIFVKSFIKQ